MRYVCTGCGNEIPEGQEFCYVCGTWADKALKANDEGTVIFIPKCVYWGEDLPIDAVVCPKCGARTDRSHIDITAARGRKMTTRDYLALLLALVLGFFNIFGIGQLVQGRWGKAFVFICITLMLWYLAPSFAESTNAHVVLVVMQFALFLLSVFDVFRGIAARRFS